MLTKPDFLEKKIILIFSKDGDKISFKNDNIVVRGNDSKIKFQLSCYSLFAIYIIGGFELTSGIIEKSKKFGFSILFFTYSFKLYASINFKLEGNTLLRKKQYCTTNSLYIAKKIIINKIENQRDILYKLRDKTVYDGIINLDTQIQKLNLDDTLTNYQIMGIEGISAKVYFNRLYKDFNWKGREPRVKRDKINALLDIGYTVLFNYIDGLLNIYGFDEYKGNLHQEFFNRKSLVCDLVEPFRPIVDYKIKKMFSLKQIEHYSFDEKNYQYIIDWKDASEFSTEILLEINLYKDKIFDYILKYYRWVMKDDICNEFPKFAI